MSERAIRTYVEVIVGFEKDGRMLPIELIWEDGRHYEIDSVGAIVQRPALKAGGQGDRYTIVVRGKEKYLWFERSANLTGNIIGRWFVEQEVRNI